MGSTSSMIPSVSQCAGQQPLTGAQAQIAVHVSELPCGGVYPKISAPTLADPTNAKLAALNQSSFSGDDAARAPPGGLRVLNDRPDHVARRTPRDAELAVPRGRGPVSA